MCSMESLDQGHVASAVIVSACEKRSFVDAIIETFAAYTQGMLASLHRQEMAVEMKKCTGTSQTGLCIGQWVLVKMALTWH